MASHAFPSEQTKGKATSGALLSGLAFVILVPGRPSCSPCLHSVYIIVLFDIMNSVSPFYLLAVGFTWGFLVTALLLRGFQAKGGG